MDKSIALTVRPVGAYVAQAQLYIYMAYAGLGTASHARRRRYVVAQGGPDLGMVEIDMYVFLIEGIRETLPKPT